MDNLQLITEFLSKLQNSNSISVCQKEGFFFGDVEVVKAANPAKGGYLIMDPPNRNGLN